jgi:hypothetical protein
MAMPAVHEVMAPTQQMLFQYVLCVLWNIRGWELLSNGAANCCNPSSAYLLHTKMAATTRISPLSREILQIMYE